MIVVISYRQDWEHRCGRGCRCLWASGSADLDTKVVKTEEEAAQYILSRFKQDPDAPYTHAIFDRWEQFESFAEGFSQSPSKGVDSIVCPYLYDDKFEDYEVYQQEEERMNGLVSRVRSLVEAGMPAKK